MVGGRLTLLYMLHPSAAIPLSHATVAAHILGLGAQGAAAGRRAWAAASCRQTCCQGARNGGFAGF